MASEKNRASVRPVVVVVVSQKENLLAKTNDKQQKQLVINSVFRFLWRKPIQTRTNGRRITQSSLMSTVIDVHARWCTRHGGGGTARGPAPSSPPPAPGVVADFEVRLGRRHGTRPSSAASAPPPAPSVVADFEVRLGIAMAMARTLSECQHEGSRGSQSI